MDTIQLSKVSKVTAICLPFKENDYDMNQIYYNCNRI